MYWLVRLEALRTGWIIVHNELSPSIHEVKKGSSCFLGVYMVCEDPLWYYKRKCKGKIYKSLMRKKLSSFFGSPLGFEPTPYKIKMFARQEP